MAAGDTREVDGLGRIPITRREGERGSGGNGGVGGRDHHGDRIGRLAGEFQLQRSRVIGRCPHLGCGDRLQAAFHRERGGERSGCCGVINDAIAVEIKPVFGGRQGSWQSSGMVGG